MKGGRSWTNLINYLLFQGGWAICVLGAAKGYPHTAAAIGLIPLLLHLLLVPDRRREGRLLAMALLMGIVVDGIHIHTGTLVFAANLHPALPPPWILVLWLQFAMSLRYSLHWLRRNRPVGLLLGGIAGAFAYWAGVRLGAAGFGVDVAAALFRIGLSWVLVMAVFLYLPGLVTADDARAVYPFLAERFRQQRN
jgi:hypothetical protein